jgi:transcription antitermination factor NusG
LWSVVFHDRNGLAVDLNSHILKARGLRHGRQDIQSLKVASDNTRDEQCRIRAKSINQFNAKILMVQKDHKSSVNVDIHGIQRSPNSVVVATFAIPRS